MNNVQYEKTNKATTPETTLFSKNNELPQVGLELYMYIQMYIHIAPLCIHMYMYMLSIIITLLHVRTGNNLIVYSETDVRIYIYVTNTVSGVQLVSNGNRHQAIIHCSVD